MLVPQQPIPEPLGNSRFALASRRLGRVTSPKTEEAMGKASLGKAAYRKWARLGLSHYR